MLSTTAILLDTLDTEFAHQSPFQETLMGCFPLPPQSLSLPPQSLSKRTLRQPTIEHINK